MEECQVFVQKGNKEGGEERENRKDIVYRKWADKEKRYWRCKRKKKGKGLQVFIQKKSQ